MSELSDRAAVARVLAGDRQAFGVLVTRHQDRILAYLRHMGFSEADAWDAAQALAAVRDRLQARADDAALLGSFPEVARIQTTNPWEQGNFLMSIGKLTTLAAALLLAGGLAACGESTLSTQGTARVTVLLTDAPIDYIEEAMVDIGPVVLVPADGSPHVVLTDDGTDGPVDLLMLQDAATQLLADAEIEAGVYSQLRLIVESASVTLADGYEFDGGGAQRALKVPSGAQTGIKLLLGLADDGDDDGGLEISGDMILVVDFDVSQSFVIQGNPGTPAGIKGMHFKPTLRVVVEDISGTISGAVTTSVSGTDLEGLTVTARLDGDESAQDFQTLTVTALTDQDGDYTLQFVLPGAHWVKVTPPAGLGVTPDSTLVEVDPSEDVTGVDFQIVSTS